MTHHSFSICGVELEARASGALSLPQARVLCVSDLHLGKSDRIARRSGTLLPPYETADTLDRLVQEIAQTDPATVICLGDSFDDLEAAADIAPAAVSEIAKMQAGREWIWIEGNHDPGPVAIGGTHLSEFKVGPLMFRHIATGQPGEITGHYHPKFGVAGVGPAKACFLYDETQVILPAFGTFTGGLLATHPVLADLFSAPPIAVLTGKRAIPVPVTKGPRPRLRGGKFY